MTKFLKMLRRSTKWLAAIAIAILFVSGMLLISQQARQSERRPECVTPGCVMGGVDATRRALTPTSQEAGTFVIVGGDTSVVTETVQQP
jgi:hypothetical protein